MFYINLYDNLIVWLMCFSFIIIFKYVLRFNQASTCALHLGSKRSLLLSAPRAFTNIGASSKR